MEMENGKIVKLSYLTIKMSFDLVQRIALVPLPAKAAYNMKRNGDSLFSFMQAIQRDGNEILAKYGAFDIAKQDFTMDEAGKQAFYDEYNKVMSEKIAEVVIREVEISQLKNAELSMQDLVILDYMITDDKLILVPTNVSLN
jgi:hypothetical protein